MLSVEGEKNTAEKHNIRKKHVDFSDCLFILSYFQRRQTETSVQRKNKKIETNFLRLKTWHR